jgi:hypothetical protein
MAASSPNSTESGTVWSGRPDTKALLASTEFGLVARSCDAVTSLSLPVREEAFGCSGSGGYGFRRRRLWRRINDRDRERKPGSVRTPHRGAQMKVVDEHGHRTDLDMVAARVGVTLEQADASAA